MYTSPHEYYFGSAIEDLKLKLMLKLCPHLRIGDTNMDMQKRIVYDDKTGKWDVLWEGKLQGKSFKTSAEAMAHLNSLKSPAPKS
jgi:hypothetical protein